MRPNVVDEILRADPRALALLAASDRKTWQALIDHIRPLPNNGTCGSELVPALLAIANLEGWQRFIFSAFNGLNPDDGLEAHHRFTDWLTAGIVLHRPKTDADALELRLKHALEDDAAGAAARVLDLVTEIETAAQSPRHQLIFGRALLLLSLRLAEEAEDSAALAAAEQAQEIFEKLQNDRWRAGAIRVRAGALLRLRKIDEAIALLDPILKPVVPWEWLMMRHRLCPSPDPGDVLLFEGARALLSRSPVSDSEIIETAAGVKDAWTRFVED